MIELIPNWLFTAFIICVVILVIALVRDRINFAQFSVFVIVLIAITIGYVKLNPDKKDDMQSQINQIQKDLTSGTPLGKN